MELLGIVKSIIFESLDSTYKVLRIEHNKEEYLVVGNFPNIEKYATYSFTGEFIETEKYGLEFKALSAKKEAHQDEDGLIKYLASKKFKGIGETTATKIVSALGINTLKIIKEKPDALLAFGIKKEKALLYQDIIRKSEKEEEIILKLYSYDLSTNMINRLLEKYQEDTLKVIEEDPYRLIKELDGYGFLKADKLARHLGVKEDDTRRIKAAINYTINQACIQKGFTFLSKKQLIETTNNLLSKNNDVLFYEKIEQVIDSLRKEESIVIKDGHYYPYYLYQAEDSSYKRLMAIKDFPDITLDDSILDNYISDIEAEIGFNLTTLQVLAIKRTVKSKVAIITGGPGTGKTTIIKALLMLEAKIGKQTINDECFINDILLLAPTGKASKRMSLACNLPAKTIHSALGYNEGGFFLKNERDKLREKLIIVDESSMIDICLLDALLSALEDNVRIVFVGDDNQLPSVGPGNVLQEMILSNLFTTSKLEEIMRQKKDSNIIKLSKMILERRVDYSIFNQKSEVFFYNADSKDILNNIGILFDAFIKKGGDFKKDLQILAPMYSGVCGIDAINKYIQEKYNHNPVFLEKNNKAYKVGDKVLQLKNEPNLGIMNGDDGIIIGYEKTEDNEIIHIDFNGHMVNYDVSNLDNLTLGYAISIHKSQGMEFENVIIPIVPAFYIMLKPKLIYTGITRAKKKLIILGKTQTLNQALYQTDESRQTSLFLNRTTNVFEINDPEIPFDTIGEAGMENISPYDFLD